VSESLSQLGQAITKALPGQFLALLLLNVLVVGGMLWVEDHRAESRAEFMNKIIENCMVKR
jgi:hypothetical protein